MQVFVDLSKEILVIIDTTDSLCRYTINIGGLSLSIDCVRATTDISGSVILHLLVEYRSTGATPTH